MDYKTKNKTPRRDEENYKEIEAFEDFELINNAFYEMGIRTKKFKELEKKYAYCENLSNEIKNNINLDYPSEYTQPEDFINDKDKPFIIEKKSAEENFEEALKRYEDNYLKVHNNEFYELLALDFDEFKEKMQITSFNNEENECLIEHYNWITDFLFIIPQIIKKDLYIDFFDYYYKDEKRDSKTGIEYDESIATSLYIKREYKETYYIETIIDEDNDNITRNLYPLTKRKLLTDHVLRFSSNHLILYRQAIKLLEKFFKVIEVKIKKQLTLADAFFCYDYYKFRLEEVEQENKKREKENLENIILQEAISNIKKINDDIYLTNQQKAKDRIPYEEIIQHEELNPLDVPSINKTSKHYIFKETKFKESSISSGTAYNYYTWIKPYIDDIEYIDIINSKQLF